MARDYSLTDRFTGGGGLAGGMAGGGGSFIPGMPNQYDPAYGGIPRVPSPAATQSASIAGNLGNLSNLYNLATGAGSASGAGVINALNQEIPGVSGSIGAATGNINQLLSGQVPGDVISQLQQQMAEIGAGQGMGPMAPNTNASYLRALGLTSLGMKQQGMQGLNALMGSVPRAPAFDPSSMMVNPQQQQEWEYLAQMMANAPRPAAAAKANVDALRMGAGFGGSSPVGGFNLPVHGGPAFGGSPMLSSPDYGPDLVYGGTGSPDQYPSANPTPQAYQNWNNLASSWASPTTTGSGSYYAGGEYYPELGFQNPDEFNAYLNQGSGDPYYDPNSMDAMYPQ